MYHSITEDGPEATRMMSVRPTDIEWQLRFLRDNGFTGLTFGDLCERIRAGVDLPARPVVLTFDDGYADVFCMDRALTAGWSAVRRSRRTLRTLRPAAHG
jgi:peptidoglycan/xylan/chitin deacetylase (PgdA/CDA1 family)